VSPIPPSAPSRSPPPHDLRPEKRHRNAGSTTAPCQGIARGAYGDVLSYVAGADGISDVCASCLAEERG
jgi:hypothetical protein